MTVQCSSCDDVPASLPDILFFFNRSPPPQIYTLSLHDALPISTHTWSTSCVDKSSRSASIGPATGTPSIVVPMRAGSEDRKSTRLNSSHVRSSYAVFCLKKKSY